ncbi:hypothetical protein FQR65_LT18964 [Abscondita terminalis]|nr:hypothetical protein FQR65_LT18964 [Abscondita terminalis]
MVLTTSAVSSIGYIIEEDPLEYFKNSTVAHEVSLPAPREPTVQAEDELIVNSVWGKKAADLAQPQAPPLQSKTKQVESRSQSRIQYDISRRRPAVSPLTTSHVAEIYNKLLDLRITNAELEKARLESQKIYEAKENVLILEKLQIENENLRKQFQFEDKERELKLLKLKKSLNSI